VKKTLKIMAIGAVVVMTAGASAFAEPRHPNETNGDWRNDSRREDRSEGRRSQTFEGRVRSFNRESDGFRVQFDRDNRWYHVPQSAFRGRHNELRIGVSLRLGGYFGGGDSFYVDSCDFIDNGGYYNDDSRYRDNRGYRDGYGNDSVSGIVERVDLYRGTILVRDNRSGRRISVVMVGGSRNRRGVDLNDVRRGDRITLSGDWRRNVFEAYNIDSLRNGRW
jgi:hypothetical protein